MAFSESAPPSRPMLAAGERDLADAEFAELGELLAGVPEPLKPLGLDGADGFVAGIAVQPAPVEPAAWLRFVFDADGHRWGADEPSPERARAEALLLRREAAMRRSLAETGDPMPWLAEADEGEDAVVATVAPWVAGFLEAVHQFPLEADEEAADDAVEAALARLDRYLAEPPIVDRPATVDAAILDVSLAVFTLYERAEAIRYRVEAVRRQGPKVGRNDPCPCGSAKKWKQCHGKAAA
jgi:uncharacterized protein